MKNIFLFLKLHFQKLYLENQKIFLNCTCVYQVLKYKIFFPISDIITFKKKVNENKSFNKIKTRPQEILENIFLF